MDSLTSDIRIAEVRMDALHPADRLESLDRAECLRLLAGQELGRIGFVAGQQPRIEPVNYRLIDGDVIVASRPGAKLDAALHNDRVAFEIDALEEWARSGWSVLAFGTASLITDVDEWTRLIALAPQAWAPIPGLSLIRIAVEDLSGRRIRIDPGGVSVLIQEPATPRPEE